ncbi:MAG: hypothetical protein AVDCRST_MAG93-5757, partial [uncultured Chloroflexia bacterium]
EPRRLSRGLPAERHGGLQVPRNTGTVATRAGKATEGEM